MNEGRLLNYEKPPRLLGGRTSKGKPAVSIVHEFKEKTLDQKLAFWVAIFSGEPRPFSRDEKIVAGNFST